MNTMQYKIPLSHKKSGSTPHVYALILSATGCVTLYQRPRTLPVLVVLMFNIEFLHLVKLHSDA